MNTQPHSRIVKAFTSKKIVLTIQVGTVRYKVFQVVFPTDGSLFVTFPYFRHRTGILAAATIPANGQTSSQVDLQVGGKIASHDVKYSHHTDGRAHFSQAGKVFTVVKRQSIALEKYQGHIFSVLIQGVEGFDQADDCERHGLHAQSHHADIRICDPAGGREICRPLVRRCLIRKPVADVHRCYMNRA